MLINIIISINLLKRFAENKKNIEGSVFMIIMPQVIGYIEI
jgi:hypothetical protein